MALAKNAAESSSITDKAAASRFQRLLDRAGKVVKETDHLINHKLTRNSENLDDESRKVKVRKRNYIWEEKKLKHIELQLSDVHQSLNAAINTISTYAMPCCVLTLIALTAAQDRIVENETHCGKCARSCKAAERFTWPC